MNDLKKLGLKLVLLLAILLVLNFIYKYTLYENDIQAYSPIINLVRNVVKDKCKIVYVGESSNITYREDDLDKRSISEFVGDYFPSEKIGSITKEASHAGIYYELLSNIPKNTEVKTIIVTLNLRSFNANWVYSSLETPLQKSLVLIKNYPPLFNRAMLSFQGYEVRSAEECERLFKKKWAHDILKFQTPFIYKNVIEWDYAMAQQGYKDSTGVVNQSMTELACHYIKTYAFQIDTLTNPRIRDFDKIVILAKKRNWNLVLNLMAENVDKAKLLVGEDLLYLMRQNRDLLVKRYAKGNVMVVDNFDCVRDEDFIDQNWTTEHYSETGRKKIAANVANCIRKFYPSEFKVPTYDSEIKNIFFNDCEGTNTWGQMQTLTTEKSFSGKKSSKTGQNQVYGITFEYPIKKLPDSSCKVVIDFELLQNEINPDIKLVIELSGKKIEYQWNGVSIKNLTKIKQVWGHIHYVFPLNKSFYQGDLIKIYLYNPTQNLAYVDDFRVEFKKE